VVLIQGNHEEMLYAAREKEDARRFWEECGGVATINSYRFGGHLEDIPTRHWDLLDGCLPFYETDAFIFTHANYLPDRPMPAQPEYQLRWALFDPSHMEPHFSGKPVVVGHTEQPNGEIADLNFAICIDTACWRHGCLTAIELPSKRLWQASRWGITHDSGELHRSRLSQLFQESVA
jgi:serine/threonine protein phosphatase 1